MISWQWSHLTHPSSDVIPSDANDVSTFETVIGVAGVALTIPQQGTVSEAQVPHKGVVFKTLRKVDGVSLSCGVVLSFGRLCVAFD